MNNNREMKEELLGKTMIMCMVIGSIGTGIFGFNILFTAVLLLGISLFGYMVYDCLGHDKDED